MRAYSSDLRLRVLAACADGMGTSEAAETFAVSEAWVRRIKQRRREDGEDGPRVRASPGRPRLLAGKDDDLKKLVVGNPGLTAVGYRDLLGPKVAAVTVWRALRRLDLTYKKSRSGPPSRTAPTSPAAGPSGGRP